jgi:regulator of replication initiation timing
LKTLACDRKELAALRRRLDDESTENSHLEKVNIELQQQLEEQKRELEAQKQAKVSHCFPRVLALYDSALILKSFPPQSLGES